MQENSQRENTQSIEGNSLLYLQNQQNFITVNDCQSKRFDKNMHLMNESELKHIENNLDESSFNINYANQVLRFSEENSSQKINISSTGFMATCFHVGAYAYLLKTNKGFSEGEHYWEFYAPVNCNEMEFGIVQEDYKEDIINPNKENSKIILQSFKTSSPRTIGLKINFNKNTLKYWLNNNYQKSRDKQIKSNVKYYPCIIFLSNQTSQPIGSQIILNPFEAHNIFSNLVSFPEKTFPKNVDQMKKTLNLYKYLKETQFEKIDQYSDIPANSQFHYVKESKNIIVQNDEIIKLVRQDNSQQFYILNSMFTNKPMNYYDKIHLQISHQNLNYLMRNSIMDTESEVIIPFIDSIDEFIQNNQKVVSNEEIIIFEIEYKAAFDFVQNMLNHHIKNQNNLCLSILINLDEQLFQMIQHDNVSNEIKSLYPNCNRSFSAFNRLQSLMNYSNFPYDQIQLAEQGILNKSDILHNICHFINTKQESESLSLINNKDKPLLQQLLIEFPDNQMLQGQACVNVPLSVSINNLPFVKVKDLQKVLTNSESNFMVTVQKTGKVQIWNTQLALCLLIENDFKVKKSKENKKEIEVQDNSYDPNYITLINEDFFEIIDSFVQDKQNITPNQDLLDQLIQMGYSIEIAKNSLINTQNAGISEAIDLISSVPDLIQKSDDQQNDSPQVWNCSECTFENQNFNSICEICEKEAPDFTKQEISRKSSINIQVNTEQKEQIKQKKKEQKKLFFEQSQIVGQFMFESQISKANPVNLALIMQYQNQVKIRIRRFGYCLSFLEQFYSYETQQENKQFICKLYGSVLPIKKLNHQDLENFIMKNESIFTIEVLNPLFNNNVDQIFQQLESYDFEIQADKVISYEIQQYDKSILEKYNFFILIRLNNEVQLLQYDISILNFNYETKKNIYSQLINRFTLPNLSDQSQISIESNNQISIFDKYNKFILKDGNILDQQKLDYEFLSIQSSFKNIKIIQGKQNNKNIIKLEKSKFMSQQISNQNNLQQPPSYHITQDLINYIKKIIQHKYIFSMSNAHIKSNLDENNNYTKHYWELNSQNYEYQIKFDKPQCIVGANINLHSKNQISNQKNQNSRQYIQNNNLYIPLRVKQFKGAQYQCQTQVSNLLFPKEQFISNYANTMFIFENLHKKQMIINNVKVISQEVPLSGGYPIGSGLIFTSNSLSQLYNVQQFMDMSPEQYKKWQQTKQGQEIQSWEPVGCFNEDKMHFELDVQRASKYVMLLPTNSRKIPNDYTKHFKDSSIEIEFFGVQGIILDDEMDIFQNQKNSEIQDSNLVNVEFFVNDQWVQTDSLQYENNQIKVLNSQDLMIEKIRFKINQEIQLDGVSIQAYSNQYDKKQYQQFIQQLDNYNTFYKQIVEQMINDDQQLRQNSLKLINQILITMPQHMNNIYEDLDIDQFIKINIFQQDGSYLIDVKNFFQHIISNQEQYNKILIKIKEFLKNLEKNLLTLNGLQGFMLILNLFMSDLEQDILNKIYDLANKFHKKDDYNILRCQYNLPCLSFEKQLFSNQNTYLIDNIQNQLDLQQNYIPIEFQVYETFCGKEIFINLKQTYNIKEILIAVTPNDSKAISNILQRLNVQIFEVIPKGSTYERKLIHNEKITNSIYHQLSKQAQQSYPDYFQLNQNINCLGFGNIDLTAKYLIIQISHQLQPYLKTPEENIPTSLFLPLIKGEQSQKSIQDIYEIDQVFQNQSQWQNTIETTNQEKFQIKKFNKKSLLKYEQKCQNTQNIQVNKIENLQFQLENLQNQLSLILNNNKDNPKEFKSAVLDLCKQIEQIQVQLINNKPIQPDQNLDFQYTLANELSFFLQKSFKKQENKYQNTIIQNLQKIFETFIVFECDLKSKNQNQTYISQNYISLIKNYFKPNLTHQQYLNLIIRIIKTFIVKPLNINECQTKELFSQVKVINTLNELQIPNEEILSFIAQKIGIQFDKQNFQFQKQNDDNIFALTGFLNLLIQGFQAIDQEQSLDPQQIYHENVYCNYCEQKKCIKGTRLKCLNCSNINCCQNKQCYNLHKQEYPQHSFIYIEEPLPFIPNITKQITFKPFQQQIPLTQNHDIQCNICNSDIQIIRMKCANCQNYNECYSCYKLNKNHNKNHVFIRIDHKIVETEGIVFQALDPILYPIKKELQQKTRQNRGISMHYQEELQPLKIQRFYSQQEKQVQKNDTNKLVLKQDQNFYNIPKLNYQQSFVVNFEICLWICHNNNLCDIDKKNILKLSFKLLNSIMKITSLEGIREILQNQNHFLTLIFNIWKYGDTEEIDLLKKFLMNMIESVPLYQKNNLELVQIKKEIRNLTLIHFETFQNWLLQQKSQQFSIYTQLFGSTTSIWINHLTFSLEFLLDSIDETKIEKNVPDLIPLGISKSLSYQHEQIKLFQQPVNKVQMFTMDTVNNLLKLLKDPKQKINVSFQTLTKLWSLTLRTIQRFQIQELIEQQIYQQVINSFFLQDYEIQSMILSMIIQFTKSLIFKSNFQMELYALILDQFFKILEQSTCDNIKYNLLKGQLEIMVQIQKEKQQSVQIQCYLNQRGIINLIQNTSAFLKKYVNFGGKEGVEMASYLQIYQLELGSDLFKIILNAQNSSNQLAIIDLFQNCSEYSKIIKQFLNSFIEWYLLNKTEDNFQVQSPSQYLIKSISDQMFYFFTIIKDHQEVTQIAISCLINCCKNQDKIISKLQIPVYITYKFNKLWSEILESLFYIWITCDKNALHAAFSTNGLEFLLNKIGLQETKSKKSILKNTDLCWKNDKDNEEQHPIFQEEEFANNIKIHNQLNQNIINYPPDFSVFKKGNKKKIIVVDMINTFYYEYELIIQLNHPIFMKNLSIGFGTSTIDYQDKIFCAPSQIQLEGGMSLTQFQPLGLLETIPDNKYSLYSVEVYKKNFLKINQNSSNLIGDQIQTLNYPIVKYLKFIIRRPKVTFIEQFSNQNGKTFQNISFGISFMSVMGFNANRLPNNIINFNQNVQKDMALRVIGKLCDPTYTQTLNILANHQEVIQKIKLNFEMMQDILDNYKNWLVPVFLAISYHNPVMGDWLTQKFLEYTKGECHSKLILEIIFMSPQYSFNRINMVYKAILQSNQNLVFVDTFCSSLRMIQTKLQFGIEQIEIILKYFSHNNCKQISQLLVTLLYNQFDIKLLNYLIDVIWKQYKENYDYLYLLGNVIIGTQNGLDWLSNDQLHQINEEIIQLLNDYSPKKQKKLNNLLYFLSCMVQIKNERINQIIIQYHLKIYQSCKNKENTDLKELEDDNYQLIFKFLKDIILGNIKLQEQFISILIQDLTSLNINKVDLFTQKILVPLLNSTQDIPVCFHPYYLKQKRIAYQGFMTQNQVKDSFPTKIFNKKEKEIFQEAIKPITDKIFSNKKFNYNFVHEQYVGQQDQKSQDVSQKIQVDLLQNAPFLIILEGTEKKKPCTLGVFCNQNINYQINSSSLDEYFNIPFSDNSFLFYAENEQFHFFEQTSLQTDSNYFGFVALYEDQVTTLGFNASIFIHFDNFEKTDVNYEQSQFQPLNLGQKPTTPMPSTIEDFVIKRVEYWSLKPSLQENQMNQNFVLSNFFVKKPDFNPQFNYRNNPVMYLPMDMKIKDISYNILQKKHQYLIQDENIDENITLYELYTKYNKNMILDIQFDIDKVESEVKTEEIQPQFIGLFETFQKQGGILKLIEVLLNCLTQWKNKDRSRKWIMWVKELTAFSELDSFFSLFIKNKKCINLLFNILSSEPDLQNDKDQIKKWQEEEQNAVKFSYNVLAQVFLVENSSKIRMKAIEKQIIKSILDRLAYLSKETQRKWVDDVQQEKETVVQKENNSDQKVKKKTGVGYGSDNNGQNQKWNVTEYQKEVALKNEQIQQLLQILENFFNFEDWEPPGTLIDMIFQSCLLPMIEIDFRSSSLLEMAKFSKIYNQELNLVKLFSQNKSLISFLQKIDDHYQPRQIESIYELLKKLKDVANIFLKVNSSAQKNEQSQKEDIYLLAQNIISTLQIVEKSLSSQKQQQNKFTDILLLPIEQKYRILLSDLRFGYMNMKNNVKNVYNHHYNQQIQKNQNPPQNKIIRLAQEFADISTSLPIEHTNSIFVRCDENRVDVLKALIMGASDTPYAHGAYEFDIYFEDTYPATPPKVNLTTTGGAKVRFNPNLYSCGKVCLSLLGTWRGNASENWDPKLSTLLQVLVSIQAIIMSDDVYFNEPGFEGEAGTKEGTDKNEAYCNIVKYCNIQYAMIDQITNPSKGFENVIRRHFYLKKEEIMKECNKWVKMSETKSAQYSGLIQDHNSSWCQKFKEKNAYQNMLKEAVAKLELELNKIEDSNIEQIEEKEQNIQENQEIIIKQKDVEKVNVDYDATIQQKELDFEDDKVKDRWSRNIGVMGIEALKKQAKSKIFMFNLNGLGVEIAKNIVLSGVNKFTIFDNNKTQKQDLNGQFYLNEIGKMRLDCLQKIQHLNNYVKVDGISDQQNPKCNKDLDFLNLKEYNVVVANGCSLDLQILINNYCRQHNIKFISCDVNGVFSRIFCDLGKQFEVLDKNGEDCNELIIKNITNEQNAKVELLQGQKHNLEDNDYILIYNVEGMQKNIMIDKSNPQQDISINNSIQQIKIINKDTIQIGDTTQFSNYVRQGLCKQIKQSIKLDFKILSEIIDNPQFDQNLQIHDFMKLENQIILHSLYITMNDYMNINDQYPNPWDQKDLNQFQELALIRFKQFNIEVNESIQKILEQFCYTFQGSFPPLQAFIGGFVAQEVIKAITNKFTPLQQIFYSDCVEVLCENYDNSITDDRKQGLAICLGKDLTLKLEHLNIFMVGVGALGCELLKNFAMLNLGTGDEILDDQLVKGKITITDPDIIELSNLNRQFLFREKHLRMSKSLTACAAIIQMNPKMEYHIQPLTEKVCDQTFNIFHDQFFEQQDIVCNALDNVQARRYMDMRCVSTKVPLLESGTLGPKGHVQVILPNQTESYESQKDPQEDGDIPQCTLKMFPEESVHCVEWALDKFGSLFTLKPKALIKAIEEGHQLEGKQLKQAIKMIKKQPKCFTDCVQYAAQKFQKYFINNIQQLMYTYPLDCKNKDGGLFWSLPKRPPTHLKFDPNNKLHKDMVSSIACLRAKVFGIKLPYKPRSEELKDMIAQTAKNCKVTQFKPSFEKAQQLQNQAENKKEEENINMDDTSLQNELKELLNQMKDVKINSEEFEKDDDTNFHIDCIYALAGCRCLNYGLQTMDWINVKLKAGRIIPALATTTACIAALQTIELVKTIKKCKLDTMKNAFLNLAIPILQLIEPGPAPKFKIKEGLEVSIWDRWDIRIKKQDSLNEVLNELKKKYQLFPKDVFYKSKAILMSAIHQGEQGKKLKEKSLIEFLDSNFNEDYCDLTVTFTLKDDSNDEIIDNTPKIRVQFD